MCVKFSPIRLPEEKKHPYTRSCSTPSCSMKNRATMCVLDRSLYSPRHMCPHHVSWIVFVFELVLCPLMEGLSFLLGTCQYSTSWDPCVSWSSLSLSLIGLLLFCEEDTIKRLHKTHTVAYLNSHTLAKFLVMWCFPTTPSRWLAAFKILQEPAPGEGDNVFVERLGMFAHF